MIAMPSLVAANRHRSNFDPFVFFDDENILAVLTDLDRFGGNDYRIPLRRQRQRDVNELTGPKPSFLIA